MTPAMLKVVVKWRCPPPGPKAVTEPPRCECHVHLLIYCDTKALKKIPDTKQTKETKGREPQLK